MSGIKSRSQDALTFAKDLRVKVQDDRVKTSTLLMGCKTVCKYLGNLDDNSWIEQELKGYDTSKFKSVQENDRA